jgi:hypothetical protein
MAVEWPVLRSISITIIISSPGRRTPKVATGSGGRSSICSLDQLFDRSLMPFFFYLLYPHFLAKAHNTQRENKE